MPTTMSVSPWSDVHVVRSLVASVSKIVDVVRSLRRVAEERVRR
jgi:hypothetical protein